MHTIIRSTPASRPKPALASLDAYRRPNYDCREHANALNLVVYVPGVDPATIEIEVRSPDLIVTAPKRRVVRNNWRSLHLEGAQRDYQLRLRLGHGLNYAALQAELHNSMLHIMIPKKTSLASAACAVA
ncbi:MAG: hypothetical protein A3G75_05145 [Verrucomicrobia bacterium RIFCSPLOWO2_12_FULL_64_8]|nr:MAG: hypothetical protein A3G75_05145 [Verrucomicrobia bacterium RIFCSPLOWO2_12_FULL_64_8]